MKKTVLIFGVTSFIGSNILDVLKNEFRIIGTFHKTPLQIPGITCFPCDVLKKDYVSSLVGKIRPDFIIYAVGMSSIRKSQILSRLSENLNSTGAINCATASDRYNSKFIYISSAFVFKPSENLFQESETPLSDTIYGKSVCSVEFHLQRSCMNYLILRCGQLYGRSFNPISPHWFESLQSKLARNEPIQVDDAVQTGFLDVQMMASVLKELLLMGVTNRLFHISSKDFMTRHEFAKFYAKVFKRDENLIQKSMGVLSRSENFKEEERSLMQFKLDTSNIEDFLKIKMLTIENSLRFSLKRLTLS